MPYAPTLNLVNSKIKPHQNEQDARLISVSLPGGVSYLAGQILEEVAGGTLTNAQHTLTFGGTGLGGSFTLGYVTGYGTKYTQSIAYSGTAATMVANIQAALDNLLGAGNTVVSGTGPYTILYQNDLGGQPLALPVVNAAALTGTSPTLTPASSVAGLTPGGYYQAYSAGTARAILEMDVQTDMSGNIITEHGVMGESDDTIGAWAKGDFLATDSANNLLLTGLNSTSLGHLGKAVRGSLGSAGCVIRIT